eukprot:1916149-Rhodomonas_salina.2
MASSAMRRFPILFALLAGAEAFSLTGPLLRPASSSPLLRSSRGPVPRVGAANFCAKLVTSDDRTGTLPWKESVCERANCIAVTVTSFLHVRPGSSTLRESHCFPCAPRSGGWRRAPPAVHALPRLAAPVLAR